MKKYILLLVLIINLVPYIKDGEMKWTTTEAEAQYYTVEFDENAGLYLCGILLYPSSRFYNIDSCEKLNVVAPSNPVIIKLAIDEFVTTYKIDNVYNSKWCVYYTMAALKSVDACDVAQKYFHYKDPTKNDCKYDEGVPPDDLPIIFTQNSVTLGESITTKTQLANALALGNTGFICRIDGHMFLIYGIENDESKNISNRLIYVHDSKDGIPPFAYKIKLQFCPNIIINNMVH